MKQKWNNWLQSKWRYTGPEFSCLSLTGSTGSKHKKSSWCNKNRREVHHFWAHGRSFHSLKRVEEKLINDTFNLDLSTGSRAQLRIRIHLHNNPKIPESDHSPYSKDYHYGLVYLEALGNETCDIHRCSKVRPLNEHSTWSREITLLPTA